MSNEMQGSPPPETQDAPKPATPKPAALLDRSDVRVKHATGVGGAVAAFVERVRSGDLGSLPVIAGLVIIWTVFTSLNPVFLSANNLVNLLFDCSTVGVISLGIVCVLMVGQIDLSVGSMSGFASAMVGMLWVNHGWPVLLAIVAAIAVGAVVGAIYALLLTRLGMPSFVATLAGLLAILGMQLYVLGATGSINLPYDSALVNLCVQIEAEIAHVGAAASIDHHVIGAMLGDVGKVGMHVQPVGVEAHDLEGGHRDDNQPSVREPP